MTAPASEVTSVAPTSTGRITNLDTVRGVAVLGILLMNAVSYGLGTSGYFNLDAAGSETWLDWLIGGFGEIFADQKFMGLFSLLFGAGIVLFADRVEAKGGRPVALSLWRNLLLLGIGLLHSLLWDGDVLVIYAVAAPFLIMMRKLAPRTLLIAGTAIVMLSPISAAIAQSSIDATGDGLGDYWGIPGDISDPVGVFLILDFFCRALGMMLIGVALHRTGVVTGEKSDGFYRRTALIGLGVGLPLSAAGLAWVAASDFSADVALVGTIPNTFATIPVVLGYLSLITLWNRRDSEPSRVRMQYVGRMALTNYISQTVIGVTVLTWLLGDADLTRTMIAGFILAVWVLQLWWSQEWLRRFRYGPLEWAWRCATYRSWQPIRR